MTRIFFIYCPIIYLSLIVLIVFYCCHFFSCIGCAECGKDTVWMKMSISTCNKLLQLCKYIHIRMEYFRFHYCRRLRHRLCNCIWVFKLDWTVWIVLAIACVFVFLFWLFFFFHNFIYIFFASNRALLRWLSFTRPQFFVAFSNLFHKEICNSKF